VGGYGPPWMSRFLAAGGGRYADIMAFHGYTAPSGDADAMISTIASFKAVFAQQGQESKPVWDTEAGWGMTSGLPDPDLQAAFLAKFYILHWSAGVERFYWYAYDNDVWGTLWDGKNGLHKAGIAYQEVHKWLTGATMASPCTTERALWTCDLTRENGYRARVLWTAKAATPSTSVALPNFFQQYRDLDGNMHEITAGRVQVSNKPILAETVTAF
jgi:polysaccharide biosynthesis protein PslG